MLRRATSRDGSAVAAIYAPFVEHGTTSFESVAPDAAEMTRRIERTVETHPWLVDEDEHGRITGYAYATAFRGRDAYRFAAETSVYVAPDAQGRGIGADLSIALLAALRASGYRTAIAVITLPNDPSVRMHESIGYREIGRIPGVGWKAGRWIDVGYWHLALEDGKPPETA
ncbi:MAG: GNAT family N-acetyltransferase [Planctomycetaceae bacterium]|nr:GNAT family N-acetyltransferase [Planctomycetaceae bacterium]